MKIKVLVGNKELLIEALYGENLQKVLIAGGVFVPGDCGGLGICKKCKVKLIKGQVGGTKRDKEGFVLSCLATVIEDLEIAINESSKETAFQFKKKKLSGDNYGIAFDLGTTTLVATLVNLDENIEVGTISELNNQAAFGADVLSRIESCNKGNLKQLNNLVIKQVNDIIASFKKQFSIDKISILLVSGNTTMQHIFLDISPRSIGVSPYTPVFTELQRVSGNKINIDCEQVIVMPMVSGYIGGDIASGILATSLVGDGTKLLVDLGTNGELALYKDGKIYCTSTAVGPAFEGASIECGLGGVSGAISKYDYVDGQVKIKTINEKKPCGICGAGLVDIISVMIREGIIDSNGGFDSKTKSQLKSRLHENKFYVTENIFVSQKDVRQFQLAKSAVYSGISVLLKTVGLDYNDLDKVYLAGGVGYYIDIDNAINTGILNSKLKDKIETVGNSSLEGAILCLKNLKLLDKVSQIAPICQIIELSCNVEFANEYIANMSFNE